MTTLLAVVGTLALLILLFGLAFVVGMRRRWAVVHGPIFWISRRWLNPRQMRSAGQPGAYAGVIRTVGRRSGRHYETPVGIIPIGAAFVIALPYGRRPEWLRNVLAAGSATIVHEGHTVAVGSPSIIPSGDVEELFSTADQRSMRLLRTDECLRLTAVETGTDHRVAGEARAFATALDEMTPAGVER